MPRDINRIRQVLKEIEKMWFNQSDSRFFQLVDQLQHMYQKDSRDPFYVEDDVLLKDLRSK